VIWRDQVVPVTPKEFDLIAVLARSPRVVYSRAQLLDLVWASSPSYQDPATVTVHVGRLRQKLEDDPQHPLPDPDGARGGLPIRAMNPLASMQVEVSSLVSERPALTAICFIGLLAGTFGIAIVLRRFQRTSPSLRRSLLLLALSSLIIVGATAVTGARLMVLSDRELVSFLVVTAAAAGMAVVMTIVVSRPLRDDLREIEMAVRAIETGDRSVQVRSSRNDELGHVARAIDDLVRRLDALEQERSAVEQERQLLLASIGHDLRTPLAALQAATEALIDDVAPDPKRYLRSIQRDIDALSALIEDLTLLSRIDVGRFEVDDEVIDLVELADDAVESLQPAASAAGIDITLQAAEAVHVQGSAPALARALRNLIENGIRHTPPGSAVNVEVTGHPDAVVRVTDQGPGFPEEFRSRAFERFTRADASRTRTSGGAGLGLAIARGLVEAHGGRIWIEETSEAAVAFSIPCSSG
jgi:signal transduction histidine kinase